MIQTFHSKRLSRKQKDHHTDIASIYSNKDSENSSTTNTNDWHRLLLTRLRPGVTGKYRGKRKDGNQFHSLLSTSVEESTVTLQCSADDLSIVGHEQIMTMRSEEDAEKISDPLMDGSINRNNHFVKNSIANRTDDHMTSLKRRVRQQQTRQFQHRPNILQETTFQSPSPSNLSIISYPEQTISARRHRQRKFSCLESLPQLVNTTRVIPSQLHRLKLNLYGY